jgi:gluconate 5-dehydrogenase
MPKTIKELYDLSGKVAFVTGGTRGLGLQMAEGLAEAGADVALASVDPADQVAIAKKQLKKTGRNVRTYAMDVTSREQTVETVKKVLADMGRIDVGITSAGINDVHAIGPDGFEKWNKIMAVNITGTYLTCAALAETMKKQGGGSLITIGSIYGLVGLDKSLYVEDVSTFFEFPAYHASKGAVVNLTRDLATNLGRFGIRANCICPATFVSDQNRMILQGKVLDRINARTPLGRTGVEDDLKGVALFLASDASKYVTGVVLPVDGGWTAW